MQYIVHEVNTIEKLQKIPKNFGIEIDIRLLNNELVLGHDIQKNNVPLNTKKYSREKVTVNKEFKRYLTENEPMIKPKL